MDLLTSKISAMQKVMPTTEQIDRRIEELDLERLRQLVTTVYANDPTPPTITTRNENIINLVDDKRIFNAYINDKIGIIIYLWSQGVNIPSDLTFGEPYDITIKEFIQAAKTQYMWMRDLHKLLTNNKEYLLGFLISYIAGLKQGKGMDSGLKYLISTLNSSQTLESSIYLHFTNRTLLELQCFYLKCPKIYMHYGSSPC
jgi:hypothetical protein